MSEIDVTKDYRFTIQPNSIADFWDYPRSKSLRLIKALLDAERFPTFCTLVGPPGCGKSALAYAIGRWASCKSMGKSSDGPCGTCTGCRGVKFGGDDWTTSSFDEFTPAHYKEPEQALDALVRKFRYVGKYGRQPGFDGWRSRNIVLLINEAHRLAKMHKAALLTELESAEDLYVLAATTDIHTMQIEPERPYKEDPLISRGEVFQINFPLLSEAVVGLQRDARKVNVKIEEDAAWKVARRNAAKFDKNLCSPRSCLADLYKLSAFGSVITADMTDLLDTTDGPVTTPRIAEASESANGDDEVY